MSTALRIAGVSLLAGYPIAVWLGISVVGSRGAGLVILAALVVLLPIRLHKLGGEHAREVWGSGIALVLLVLLSILLNDQRLLLAMPVLVNATFLIGFGSSLLAGRTPIVERFARMTHRDLSPDRVHHCRVVTKVWCLFFIINGLVSLWLALFASLTTWAIYTGGIAYVLMGALFAGEYAIRRIRFG